ILPAAWFTAILDVHPENHHRTPLPGVGAVVAHAGETPNIRGRFRLPGAALQIAGVAELAVQRRLELAARVAGFTAAHQAVEVGGLDADPSLLLRVLPVALDLIELIKAPEAGARRPNLTTAGALGDLDVRQQRAH